MPEITPEARQAAHNAANAYATSELPVHLLEAIADEALEAAVPVLAGDYKKHLTADHVVMVKLGDIAEAAVRMLEYIKMDTDEDRRYHAKATGALRSVLTDVTAALKEANDAAGSDGGNDA